MNYSFLKEINSIKEKYEEYKKISGENFNIFSIMSMESDEVFTHSALIAELLNPNGTHGLDEKPLQLFVEKIVGNDFTIDYKNAVSLKEEHIGKINEDKTEGGRLDIIVKEKNADNSSDKIFVIENKIYAGEQKNQLYRYKNQYPNAKLFFLTINGFESKQISEEENKEKEIYTSVSYEKDILNWIEECAKLAYDKPMLREILKQYIYLIKKLTNQTTNTKMALEIQKIISENLEASKEIFNNYENTIESLQLDFINTLYNILQNKFLNWEVQIINYEKDNRKSIDLKSKVHNYRINFRFKNSNKYPVINIFNTPEEKSNEFYNLGFRVVDKNEKNKQRWLEYKMISLQDLKLKKVENIKEKIEKLITIF